jgi:hypothetical protein
MTAVPDLLAGIAALILAGIISFGIRAIRRQREYLSWLDRLGRRR